MKLPKDFVEGFYFKSKDGTEYANIYNICVTPGRANIKDKYTVISSSVLNIDVKKNGIGGLDEGSIEDNTFYLVILISKIDEDEINIIVNDNINVILSKSENPKLINGYKKLKVLGAIPSSLSFKQSLNFFHVKN